jgi:hypothetical protein
LGENIIHVRRNNPRTDDAHYGSERYGNHD